VIQAGTLRQNDASVDHRPTGNCTTSCRQQDLWGLCDPWEKTVSAAQASADLLEMLDDLGRGRQFVIKRGRRKAVLTDYERLRTLEALVVLARDSPLGPRWLVPMRTCGPDVCTL
jgi:hypothetical protein